MEIKLNDLQQELVVCSIIDSIHDLRECIGSPNIPYSEYCELSDQIDELLSLLTEFGDLTKYGLKLDILCSEPLH